MSLPSRVPAHVVCASLASARQARHARASKSGQAWKGHCCRNRPGAVLVAISAASMSSVPDPHIGSANAAPAGHAQDGACARSTERWNGRLLMFKGPERPTFSRCLRPVCQKQGAGGGALVQGRPVHSGPVASPMQRLAAHAPAVIKQCSSPCVAAHMCPRICWQDVERSDQLPVQGDVVAPQGRKQGDVHALSWGGRRWPGPPAAACPQYRVLVVGFCNMRIWSHAGACIRSHPESRIASHTASRPRCCTSIALGRSVQSRTRA